MGQGKDLHFPIFILRERERRGREHPSFSLRSSKCRQTEFVKPKVKVHLLDEGYAWVPKMRGFIEDPKEEFSRNQRFLAREASHPYDYASRYKDSSYLALFFTFWAEKWESRVPARCFSLRRTRRRHVTSPGSFAFCLG